ncbi:cuticle protein 19-like [Penaeus indicus]|uniref:cuticle protein 19-like n=1 Tax=Penaeus indicus TaxID=29960 RepID=UPI00300C03AC
MPSDSAEQVLLLSRRCDSPSLDSITVVVPRVHYNTILWKLILNTSPKPPANGYAAPRPAFAPAKYDFNYAVKDEYSDNDFGYHEARDGDNTQGSYYVQLIDSRLQKITYIINGDSGFVADISYEGDAQYPAEQPAYKHAPSYA